MDKENVKPLPQEEGLKIVLPPGSYLADFNKELSRINNLTQSTNKLTAYVILILVVMVATMLLMVWGMVVDANNRKTDSNLLLMEKISTIESKLK